MRSVLILFGGASPEHEVSRRSAASVLENINREKKTRCIPWALRKTAAGIIPALRRMKSAPAHGSGTRATSPPCSITPARRTDCCCSPIRFSGRKSTSSSPCCTARTARTEKCRGFWSSRAFPFGPWPAGERERNGQSDDKGHSAGGRDCTGRLHCVPPA